MASAFALFYAVMGVLIARWADRSNRVMVICVTALLWSAAGALSGLATNFTLLLLIRGGGGGGRGGMHRTGLCTASRIFQPRRAAGSLLRPKKSRAFDPAKSNFHVPIMIES